MPKNLLVADDSVVIQKSVGITLAQEDYAITYVGNGEDALAKARQQKPDLILADVVMPKKNGYELCELIKKDPALKTVPVLLLAGAHEPFDENRGRTVGADSHIIKPFESKALLDRVRDLLSGTPMAVSPAPAVSPTATIAGQAPVVPSRPIAPPPAVVVTPPPVTPKAATPAREAPMLDLELGEPGSAPSFDTSMEGIDFSEMPAGEAEAPAIELAVPEEPVSEPLPADNFWDLASEPAAEPTPPVPAAPPRASAPESPAPVFRELPEPPWQQEPAPKSLLPRELDPGFDLSGEEIPAEEKTKPRAVPPKPATTVPVEAAVAVPGLSQEQIEAIVTKVFRGVVERIAWEVVPDLAETIIKEELARLTKESS